MTSPSAPDFSMSAPRRCRRAAALGVLALAATHVLLPGISTLAFAQDGMQSTEEASTPAPTGTASGVATARPDAAPASAATTPATPTTDRIDATADAPGQSTAPDAASAESSVTAPQIGSSDDLAAPEPTALPQRSASLPHDLSPMGMFMAADWVVKAVMLGLAFASLVTWTILVAKGLELVFAKRRATSGVRRLSGSRDLAEALEERAGRWRGPVAMLAAAAEGERARSRDLSPEGVKERVSVALSRVEAGAARSISRGTGLLATIGSTAPFVGLFGTVWGIMNAFIGISQANTTNLAVVAPGIAEALLATAIGLVAAIPAVIVYNVFARSIAGYRAILSDGSALVLQHLSRDLDQQDASRRMARHRNPAPMREAAE